MIRLIGLALTLVLLLAPTVEAAVQVFIDNNNNGVFDAGDVDMSDAVKTTSMVVTTESIVVPDGASLRLGGDSAALRAGKAILVDGNVSAAGSLFLSTDSGAITIGPRSVVVSRETIQMTAGGDLVVDRSRIVGYGEVMLESLNGSISLTNATMTGGTRMELNGYATDGGLVMSVSTLQATRGLVNIHLEGAAQVTQSRLFGNDVNVSARGGWAELLNSFVRVTRTGSITVQVEVSDGAQAAQAASSGSLLDVRGTRFYGSADSIVLIADHVDGY
jgi:hypothetical protein